jgi:hypothetical protein
MDNQPNFFDVLGHFVGAHWWQAVLAIVLLWAFNAWFGPVYSVWQAHKEGQADLARAQNDSKVQVAEAAGRLAAAEANKQAAIVEAEAVAKQIEIIGQNVKDHPLYLTWQWVKMMEERDGQTIYVPTEANLPILEAGRGVTPAKG